MVARLYVRSSTLRSFRCGTKGYGVAYDIKMIMDRGTVDILRPEWIKDSVAKGELMPFKRR